MLLLFFMISFFSFLFGFSCCRRRCKGRASIRDQVRLKVFAVLFLFFLLSEMWDFIFFSFLFYCYFSWLIFLVVDPTYFSVLWLFFGSPALVVHVSAIVKGVESRNTLRSVFVVVGPGRALFRLYVLSVVIQATVAQQKKRVELGGTSARFARERGTSAACNRVENTTNNSLNNKQRSKWTMSGVVIGY